MWEEGVYKPSSRNSGAGPDKSIARPPGTSPKSRRASLFRLYDARSGKCQKIARTVKSASIYGKKVWSKDVNKYW